MIGLTLALPIALVPLAPAAGTEADVRRAATGEVIRDFDVRVQGKKTSLKGRPAVWIRSISIHGKGVSRTSPHVRCDQKSCLRRRGRGKYRKRVTSRRIAFDNVNWIIIRRQTITVALHQKGRIGRFRKLGLAFNGSSELVITEAGCLRKGFVPRKCPESTTVVAPGTPVAVEAPVAPTPPSVPPPALHFWEFTAGNLNGGGDDLFAIARSDAASGKTALHALGADGSFGSFIAQTGTALGPTYTNEWSFCAGDQNRDGIDDLYAISRNDVGTNSTAVHVLDGAGGFQHFTVQTGTPIPPSVGSLQDFVCGDYNGDGVDDLYEIVRLDPASQMTAVHVYDGAKSFSVALAHSVTALHRTDSGQWSFVTGDYNRDGRDDLYAIARNDAPTVSTAIHVLDAANLQIFLLQTGTPLHPTDSLMWDFAGGDFNADGIGDLYAIARNDPSTGRTAVHVLDGASRFQNFTAHATTALHATD